MATTQLIEDLKIEIISDDKIKVNGIELEPSSSPGTLPTWTWNKELVLSELDKNIDILEILAGAYQAGRLEEELRSRSEKWKGRITFFLPSLTRSGPDGNSFFLLASPGGNQRILVNICSIKKLFGMKSIKDYRFTTDGQEVNISIVPADYNNIALFAKGPGKDFAPKALGPTKRLGVGNRMTTLIWPYLFKAAREKNIRANLIQNSVYRELAPAGMIFSKHPADITTLPGLGKLGVGHTGTSIEGLWLYGVVSAIEAGFKEDYGADADHIPVKQGKEGLNKAKELVDCARYFTFYTLDTSARFYPEADTLPIEEIRSRFNRIIEKDELLNRYSGKFEIKSVVRNECPELLFNREEIMRIALKFHDSIEAVVELDKYIREIKQGEEYDLEVSLDECPELTTEKEMFFILNELKRRGVIVTQAAPNVGFEKRVDYRLPDGLDGLRHRVSRLAAIAEHFGAILDFHSGSDKSAETYRTISDATGGNIQLKVSGKLQLIYGETIQDMMKDFFLWWWNWTLDYAVEEKKAGSKVAEKYVRAIEERKRKEGDSFKPSAGDTFFTNFSYAAVGVRDDNGRFLYRNRFYDIPKNVKEEYGRRIEEYISTLARDLGLLN
ncbi:MAG: tagaturonate epimerase family protein [Candidatus Eremiobacteraeota bacterium]|nr:tagaturonate epimerase family protein [Candidatus Eremiobacteraeota bacterium]